MALSRRCKEFASKYTCFFCHACCFKVAYNYCQRRVATVSDSTMHRDSFSVNSKTPYCVSKNDTLLSVREGPPQFAVLPLPTASTMEWYRVRTTQNEIMRRFIGGNLRHHNCINASLPPCGGVSANSRCAHGQK
jgi:hypothetical protein